MRHQTTQTNKSPSLPPLITHRGRYTLLCIMWIVVSFTQIKHCYPQNSSHESWYRLDLSQNKSRTFLPIRFNRASFSSLQDGSRAPSEVRVVARGSIGFEPVSARDLEDSAPVYWRGSDHNMFAAWWRDHPVISIDTDSLPPKARATLAKALNFECGSTGDDSVDDLLGRLKALLRRGAPIPNEAIERFSQRSPDPTFVSSRGPALVPLWGRRLSELAPGYLCDDDLFAKAEVVDTLGALATNFQPRKVLGLPRGGPFDSVRPSAARIEFEELFGVRPLQPDKLEELLKDTTRPTGDGAVIDDASSPMCTPSCHYNVKERAVRDFVILEQSTLIAASELPYDLVARYGSELAAAYNYEELRAAIDAGKSSTEDALAEVDATYAALVKASETERNGALERLKAASDHYRKHSNKQLLDHTYKLWQKIQMATTTEPWTLNLRTTVVKLVTERSSLTEVHQPVVLREYVSVSLARGSTRTPWTWVVGQGDYPPDYAYRATRDTHTWPQFEAVLDYFSRCRALR